MSNSLVSGTLKKSLLELFENGQDDYQFEYKEYLILIERENVSLEKTESVQPISSLPKIKGVFANSRLKSLIHPREMGNGLFQEKDGDISFVEPRCIPENPLECSIDSLLGMLNGGPLKRSRSSTLSTSRELSTGKDSTLSTSKELSTGKDSTLSTSKELSTGKDFTRNSSFISSSTLKELTPYPIPSHSIDNLPLLLPTYENIQHNNISYYAHSSSSGSTLSQYMQWIHDTCIAVIHYILFTTMSL